MRIGIFAKTFAGSDPLTVLTAAKVAGYTCVQYNFACSGLASMPDTVPEAAITAIADAVAATGVTIAALSATYNMIHPDVSVRETGQRRLGVAASVAERLGIPMLTLCTGTRDPDDQWSVHPDNQTPAAWNDLLIEMCKAADIAEAHGLQLGIEPEQANVVRDADDALQLIAAIGSNAVRIVLDPANLFEQATPEAANVIITDAIDRLGPHIALAHAKDRDTRGHFVTAGTGVVDFPAFVARLRASGFNGALVTHGLTAAEAPEVADFLSGLVQ